MYPIEIYGSIIVLFLLLFYSYSYLYFTIIIILLLNDVNDSCKKIWEVKFCDTWFSPNTQPMNDCYE